MKLALGVLLLSFAISLQAQIFDKAIHGNDDRSEVDKYPSPLFRLLAQSTISMVDKRIIFPLDGEYAHLSVVAGVNYGEAYELCSDVKFVEQNVSAGCSGFLIAPDLIATAGHCMEKQESCDNNQWVFDFHQKYEITWGDEKEEYKGVLVRNSSVYNCKEIVKKKYDWWGNDYAIVRLDRAVTDRKPLKIRKEGRIAKGTEVVIIGNPHGLTTKIGDAAVVKKSSNGPIFETNLDAFTGNSGSAVLDAKTGTVEGILVRGYRFEFDYDKKQKCNRLTKLDEDSGFDVVTRITEILPF